MTTYVNNETYLSRHWEGSPDLGLVIGDELLEFSCTVDIDTSFPIHNAITCKAFLI